jgi:hypothetical protein
MLGVCGSRMGRGESANPSEQPRAAHIDVGAARALVGVCWFVNPTGTLRGSSRSRAVQKNGGALAAHGREQAEQCQEFRGGAGGVAQVRQEARGRLRAQGGGECVRHGALSSCAALYPSHTHRELRRGRMRWCDTAIRGRSERGRGVDLLRGATRSTERLAYGYGVCGEPARDCSEHGGCWELFARPTPCGHTPAPRR